MPAEGVPPVSEQGPSLAAVTADTAVPSLAPVPPGGRGRPGGCSAPGGASRGLSWPELEGLVRLQAASLSAPPAGRAGLTGGGSDARGRCLVCRGPSDGRARCFQCELHEQCAAGSLADVVVPVAYAVKGGSHARRLWQYKSPGPAAAAAAVLLRALLLVFLRDHRACVCRAAGMPAGPTHLAVVPTARSRPGQHPLRALLAPYLSCRWAHLVARPVPWRGRDLDPARFEAAPLPGARVLLLDDTWTTGASAQSAAMALRRAGARRVATVILGRHVGRAGVTAPPAGFGPRELPFQPGTCAVHAGPG